MFERSDFENKCSEVEILQETVAEIKRSAAIEVDEKVKETEQLVKNKVCKEHLCLYIFVHCLYIFIPISYKSLK